MKDHTNSTTNTAEVSLVREWRKEVQRLTTQRQRMVSMHLTDLCNSKCSFCVVNSPIKQIPIETSTLVDYLRSQKDRGFDILNLHGGEPTISKALFPVLKAGREIGVREIHLQTNGITLANQGFLDKLIEAGVSQFVVSIHGHTSELQEEITRTKHTFDKIVRGLKNCIQSGRLVRTNTVICKKNLNYLSEIFQFISELNVQWINVSALHPSEHANTAFYDLVVHPAQVKKVVPQAVQRLRESHPEILVQLEGFAVCHAPGLEGFHLDSDGLRDIEVLYHDYIIKGYNEFMQSSQRKLLSQCEGCAYAKNCNGLYNDYVAKFDGVLVWPKVST